ncbi:MAG: hypothetical protein JWO06_466 [Bacteroidota bacterium]|nr:hypothetical protein [Bacteroidota bacterium]
MKIKSLLVFACLLFLFTKSNAQCGSRYIDSIFQSVDTVQNVVFTTTAGGAADTLLMDVYVPHGDNAINRHFIIWAHGGAFFQGTKNDNDIQYLCSNFAKRGYVCASINYRLAPNVLVLYDSAVAFDYIMKATNDMKSAIRYVRKDIANGNTYNLDSNYIFGAGSSAGAIMIDFAETIDSLGEADPSIQTAINNNGGLDGNSGNDGYSSKVKAVASLAGGISQLSWIGPGNPPMVFCQGTADPIIPYDCAYVFNGYTGGFVKLFQLCGSDQMHLQCQAQGVATTLMPFAGQGHVPWSSHQDIMTTTDSTVAEFFYHLDCLDTASAVAYVADEIQLNIFPNPATNQFYLQSPSANQISDVSVCDLMGRIVFATRFTNQAEILSVNVGPLSMGLYVVKVNVGDIWVNRKIYLGE